MTTTTNTSATEGVDAGDPYRPPTTAPLYSRTLLTCSVEVQRNADPRFHDVHLRLPLGDRGEGPQTQGQSMPLQVETR